MSFAPQSQSLDSGHFSNADHTHTQTHAQTLKAFMPSNELFGVGFMILLCVMLLQHQRGHTTQLGDDNITTTISASPASVSQNGVHSPPTKGALLDKQKSGVPPQLSKQTPISIAAAHSYLLKNNLSNLIIAIKPSASEKLTDETQGSTLTNLNSSLVLRLRGEAFFSEGDSRLSRAGSKALNSLASLAGSNIHLELSARPNAQAEYLYGISPDELANARIAALEGASSKQGQFGSITISDAAF